MLVITGKKYKGHVGNTVKQNGKAETHPPSKCKVCTCTLLELCPLLLDTELKPLPPCEAVPMLASVIFLKN